MAQAQPVEAVAIPVTPSAEVWRTMSPAQREAHLLAVYAALEQEHIRAGEGVRLEVEQRRQDAEQRAADAEQRATAAEQRAAALEAELAALRAPR